MLSQMGTNVQVCSRPHRRCASVKAAHDGDQPLERLMLRHVCSTRTRSTGRSPRHWPSRLSQYSRIAKPGRNGTSHITVHEITAPPSFSEPQCHSAKTMVEIWG